MQLGVNAVLLSKFTKGVVSGLTVLFLSEVKVVVGGGGVGNTKGLL